MLTINQLKRVLVQVKNDQKNPFNKPQTLVVVDKVSVMNCKKPNSANRKIIHFIFYDKRNKPTKLLKSQRAINTICKGKRKLAYVPSKYDDNTINKFSKCLIRGGNRKDLNGVSLIVIRGPRDAKAEQNRKRRRSIYGVKKPK